MKKVTLVIVLVLVIAGAVGAALKYVFSPEPLPTAAPPPPKYGKAGIGAVARGCHP
jgi:hypothetical protein